MDMDMVTMDTMARGLLRPSLDMVIMVMDMVLDMVMDMAMVTMDIMARGLLMLSLLLQLNQLLMPSPLLLLMLSLLPLLSPDMDMVMDMAMDILATDMVVMATMDIMARDLLSQDMDIMAMDMVMDTMDMVMAMDMDIMVRQEPKCCYFLEFSTTEVDQNRSSQNKHTF